MPPELVTHRLARMLGILVSYAGEGEVSLDEVTQRFHCTTRTLTRDCLRASEAGRPPWEEYHDLLNLVVDEDAGTLDVWVPHEFGRPARLTPGEGLALLTAAATVLALRPDDQVLATAVAAVRAALDIQGDLAVEVPRPPALEPFLEGWRRQRVIEGRYWSSHRDTVTERSLEPHIVFFAAGAWYARCRDRRDGAVKLFRVDRFERARVGIEAVRGGTVDDSTELFTGGEQATTVRLWFPAAARWVREALDVRIVGEDADGFTAELVVGGTAWLANLVLRTGARVLAPPSLTDVAADVARRALARYETGT